MSERKCCGEPLRQLLSVKGETFFQCLKCGVLYTRSAGSKRVVRIKDEGC
jgi:uncharacterized C2H2 Zn-finger protein